MRTIKESTQKAIADAIRAKTGKTAPLTTAQMAQEIASISGGGQTGVAPVKYEWVQAPAATVAYMDNVTYDPNDRTYSNIADYAPSTALVANYKPVGQTVPVATGTLYLDGRQESVGAGNKTLTNIAPNGDHVFAVLNGGEVVQVGTLHPTHSLRWIDCPQARNVRDLGGGTIKYNKLIRGGVATEADRDVLVNQCGVTADLDLRGEGTTITSSPLGDDIVFCHPSRSLQYVFNDSETWKEVLEFVFDIVGGGGSVFFHCSRGADRTGTVALVLETLLGRSMSDVDKDYELSLFALGVSGTNADMLRTKLSWNDLINSFNSFPVGNTFREKVINWVGSLGIPIEKLNLFIDAMTEGTASPVAYSFGISNIINELTEMTTDNSTEILPKYQSYRAELTPAATAKYIKHTVTIGGVNVTEEVSRLKYRRIADSMETGYTIGVDIPWGRLTGDLVINAEARVPQTGYTLLDYLAVYQEQTGYVDIGYTPTASTGFSVTFSCHSVGSSDETHNMAIFGNPDFATGLQKSNGFRGYIGTKKSFQLSQVSTDGGTDTVSVNYLNDGKARQNGEEVGWNAGGANPTSFAETFKVFFAGNHAVFVKKAFETKVYEVVVTEGSLVVKTFKPARRNEDGVVGFLDTNTDTFWPSTGAVYDPQTYEAMAAIMTLEYDELL